MAKIGNFEIVEELGRGAMGVVFRGFDPVIGRPVAIKVIRAQAFSTNAEDQEARLRFAREAAAAGRLSHPNIVTVFHLGEEHDYQYLVMELVEGEALERAAPDKCLPILRQIAEALDYAHGRGVIHRDVKPANILVTSDGRVKLTDFGIARISSQTITQTGMTFGTPSYMAPEQMMASRVDGKADQFSLAVIAFELLTGKKPFEGPTSQALMLAILQGERPAAHEVNPALPPLTSGVMRRAMDKEPGNRFPTCLDFVGALETALAPLASGPPAFEPAPDTNQQGVMAYKWHWRSVAIVGIVLTFLVGWYFWQRWPVSSIGRPSAQFNANDSLERFLVSHQLPVQPDGYVTDHAFILSDVERASLESALSAISRDAKVQVALVILPSLKGATIAEASLAIFRKWGIGEKEKNNGLLLLLSVNEHQSRIELGYGLSSKISDQTAAEILRNMRPFLAAGKFADGLHAAINDLRARLQ